jgi:hypothetical protein
MSGATAIEIGAKRTLIRPLSMTHKISPHAIPDPTRVRRNDMFFILTFNN